MEQGRGTARPAAAPARLADRRHRVEGAGQGHRRRRRPARALARLPPSGPDPPWEGGGGGAPGSGRLRSLRAAALLAFVGWPPRCPALEEDGEQGSRPRPPRAPRPARHAARVRRTLAGLKGASATRTLPCSPALRPLLRPRALRGSSFLPRRLEHEGVAATRARLRAAPSARARDAWPIPPRAGSASCRPPELVAEGCGRGGPREPRRASRRSSSAWCRGGRRSSSPAGPARREQGRPAATAPPCTAAGGKEGKGPPSPWRGAGEGEGREGASVAVEGARADGDRREER